MSPFELPAADERPAADPAPDAHRLDRAVVEDVRLRQVDDRAAVLVLRVAQPVGAADDVLGRDSVDVLRHRPHEVAVAARGDVVRESVGLEVAQQLDHRQVAAVAEAPAESRVLPLLQERVRRGPVVVDGPARERLQDAAHQHLDVAVVARVVLGDHVRPATRSPSRGRPSTAGARGAMRPAPPSRRAAAG